MERLIYFFYQYRAFFTFLVLEVLCAWLIISNNSYQGAQFFNSSNSAIASMNNFSQGIRNYFLLSDQNTILAEENASLRRELEKNIQLKQLTDTLSGVDTTIVDRFDFVSAKVVNNQVDRYKNFITISKGANAGITPGMAVISPLGAIGKVKVVSDHYSVVTSILHIDVMVSAELKRTGHFGTAQWKGRNPQEINLLYIPPHVKPEIGDTVITSGYNAVFPPGIMIGTISQKELDKEALFYELKVKLSQDFQKLSYVTVVKSRLKHEQDSLEQAVIKMEK
ncbi:rod shape-determining protein MreC [Pseudochryseolinea flava]|uniref:Cell shape-determining protein MreC n=1 Tax=Pseudochryseolinea flava TaxID=2059302 RepID=A0A364Y9Y6_9BACT|nr:rod shape-determining protein MreC [Pseudochryseolinea flava]RAW03002.1 rod shape-determining protein MreC [Pseudochryseolinea flava]